MLKEDYYLANFLSLITFVEQTYQGLLSDQELRWYASFMRLSEPTQRLYVRLISRRSSIFRTSKLRYPEIPSIETAAQALCVNSLGSTDAPQDLSSLVSAFTKPELVNLLALNDQTQLSRKELEEYIFDRDDASDYEKLQGSDSWIQVEGLAEFTVFKLCFFGNCYQDLSEFVLRDLGLYRYEQYKIDSRSRVFQSREQIEAHLNYFECATQLELIDQNDASALLEISKHLPTNKHLDAHLTRRVDRILNTIARQLERLDKLDEALSVYQQSTRPPSRERQTRLLIKLDRIMDANTICLDIEKNAYTTEELDFVETIQPKLRKLQGLPTLKKARFRPLTSKLTLSQTEDRVELIARDFYGQFGECFYTENTLINGVLGLFIWDIIFEPIEGVFYNPFQSAPADFYQAEFVTARQASLDKRFAELNDSLRFSARVWERFELSHGVSNPLVNWHYLNEALLSKALIRIPAQDWRVLFNRMLADIRNHSSGFPDLILFPNDGFYEMLEIKGPGDAVQKNQRRWMAYFTEHRIPYRVVHIKWATRTNAS